MPSAPQSRENSAPSAEQVRGQLERVLASSTFARSERLGRFLAFAVDETLAGRSNTFKESVIASALYSSDAASDSVVRVDARRLRDKLREYYTDSIDGTPEWSPDGKWIYFASSRADQKSQIWKMSPDGGRPAQVTRNGGFRPRLSPDGRHVYHLDRLPQGMTGRGRLMRTPVDGGEEVEVHPDMFGWIWDVSSIGIVFLTQTASASAVDLIRYEDHKVVRLGLLPFRPSPIGIGWSVSRDGRWLLSSQIDRHETDLMLIDNFR
jgi:dipeptidyl aminopeptidase/acylaminoacyl peptidase